MTGHWEFTYGMERVKEIVEKDFKGKIDFIAQNVKTTDFGDPVFTPYVMREINGVPVAIIGQAFPYTPIANPRYMVADWSFGIQDENMQKMVDEARAKGAQVVVCCRTTAWTSTSRWPAACAASTPSSAATRTTACRWPVPVANAGGKTLVTNAGSNGKFLGVMDFEVKGGKVVDYRYRLLPVFANLLPADPAMDALITKVRAPYEAKLAEKLAVTDGLLYRRGNFNGSWDQLLCDALIDVQGAEIAFSPGFRWGTSLLPGEAITRELMMDQLAITYPYATVTPMTRRDDQDHPGRRRRQPVQPRPLLPAGRRHGARRRPAIHAARRARRWAARITDMRLDGKPLDAGEDLQGGRLGAGGQEAASAGNKPVWDLVEPWLTAQPGAASSRARSTRRAWWASRAIRGSPRASYPHTRSTGDRPNAADSRRSRDGLLHRVPVFDVVEADGRIAVDTSRRRRAPAAAFVQPRPDGDGAFDGGVREVAAARDDDRNSRGSRRVDAARGVLDRHRFTGLDAQRTQREPIRLRIGFLALHVFAAHGHREPLGPALAQVHAQQGLDVRAARRRRDAHRQPAGAALPHQREDALAQRQAPFVDELSVDLVLLRVQRARERLARVGLRRRVGVLRHVEQQALAPAGDAQQLAVARLVPAPRQVEGFEGEIEGDAMAVALRLGQRAVDIPEQCLQFLQAGSAVRDTVTARRVRACGAPSFAR